MRFGPPVSFARRPDGRHLAYQVAGDGELDLAFLLGFPTNLALLLAATYPDRVSVVVPFGSQPTTLRDQDHPWARPPRNARGSWRRSERRPTPRRCGGGGGSCSPTWWTPPAARPSWATAAGIRAELRELGLGVRVGLHRRVRAAGRGHRRDRGAHRRAGAGPGGSRGDLVLADGQDLVVGSGFAFTDRGTHRLKGVPEPWQLFAVELAPRSSVPRP